MASRYSREVFSTFKLTFSSSPCLRVSRQPFISNPIRWSSTTPSTDGSTAAKISLPYHVSRTPSDLLPVYHDSKAAGMQKFTMIKKISGDKNAFITDLVAALAVTRDDVRLNPVTGSVNVKGWVKDKVKTWLVSKGL